MLFDVYVSVSHTPKFSLKEIIKGFFSLNENAYRTMTCRNEKMDKYSVAKIIF